MLFEGSEKKVEVHFSPEFGDLRDRGRDWWASLVAECEAQILSEIHSADCTAYLLSESSLFVWKDRMTLITCGQTQLVRSISYLTKHVGSSAIANLIFERKNEYFPQMQKSDFFTDVLEIKKDFDTEDFRFGDVDGHHLFLSHIKKDYQPEPEDRTIELLMYNLKDSEVSKLFTSPGVEKSKLREALPFEKWLPGFEIDDHVFDPFGYSLNALNGSEYYTLHVTPQEGSSYVSFETNSSRVDYEKLVQGVTEWLQPQSFDVVTFDATIDGAKERSSLSFSEFQTKTLVREKLSCGYDVCHQHFFAPSLKEQRAFRIEQK